MNKILSFYGAYSQVISIICLIKVAIPYALCRRVQILPMSYIDHESALAELAQASTAFNHELTEEPLSFQDKIQDKMDEEGRGAEGAYPKHIDIVLPDAPAIEIPDTKTQKEGEGPTPLITIGTVKLYELYGGEEPQNCEYVIICLPPQYLAG